MRAFGLISLFVTLCIIGFLMMKQTGTSDGAPSASQAAEMEDKARAAVALSGRESLKAAIENFHTMKQRYPESLEELKTSGLVDSVPANVDYDPATGEVKPHAPQ
jgi:competence protein ComGC